MAGENREQGHPLGARIDELGKAPYAFSFFQALRLIECLYPRAPRLGASRRPGDDPIRLAQEPSMRFESASLTAFEAQADGKPHKLTVRLLGLLGPNGPLPLHLTEYAQERLQRHKDPTFSRFLDVFHHRMLSLFYRAWANNEPTVSFDRPESDRFSDYVGTLAGLGMSALQQRDEISDWTKQYCCGHLARQTKCPEGLQAILTEYFDLPARLNEFVGEWLPLPQKDIFRLGADPSNGTLGGSIILGAEVWSWQHKFRVALGPLRYDDYQSFLPGGSRIRHLAALVRNYAGDEQAWDLMLILKWQEVPPFCLDGQYRLGWTTWLGERPVEEDADDLVLGVSANVNLQHKDLSSE
jgi:type VI secretion system protein ImpH